MFCSSLLQDKQGLINQKMLYSCCPYLSKLIELNVVEFDRMLFNNSSASGELRALLLDNNNNNTSSSDVSSNNHVTNNSHSTRNTSTVRKITPISTQVATNTHLNDHQMQVPIYLVYM